MERWIKFHLPTLLRDSNVYHRMCQVQMSFKVYRVNNNNPAAPSNSVQKVYVEAMKQIKELHDLITLINRGIVHGCESSTSLLTQFVIVLGCIVMVLYDFIIIMPSILAVVRLKNAKGKCSPIAAMVHMCCPNRIIIIIG